MKGVYVQQQQQVALAWSHLLKPYHIMVHDGLLGSKYVLQCQLHLVVCVQRLAKFPNYIPNTLLHKETSIFKP